MKNTTAILSVIFTATAAFIITSVVISCKQDNKHTGSYINGPELLKRVRAEVLENNTVTYCILNDSEIEIYHPNDTVWLNLNTHTIDDTSDNTMMCVLKQTNN